MKIIPLKITEVHNSNVPGEEFVRLQATVALSTKGYALVDRTFDAQGNISNEFRHIFVFPELDLKAKEQIIVYTGEGINGKAKFQKSEEEFHRLFWGSKSCVFNDNGGERVTLISYIAESAMDVPEVKK